MKRKWKLGSKGMTLLEVIVAFAIFAIATTILMVGFNGALKVMGNSNEIKEKSQSVSSKIELDNGTFEKGSIEFTPKSGVSTKLTGKFQTATETKRDGLDITKKIFTSGDLEAAPVPSAPAEEKKKKLMIIPPEKGKAYFQSDRDRYIFPNTGLFNNKYFDESKEEYTKLRSDIQFSFTGQDVQKEPYSRVQELYLMGEKNPVDYKPSANNFTAKGFAVKLLYFGSNAVNINESEFVAYKIEKLDKGKADSFTVYNYTGNNRTILYLPHTLKIKIKASSASDSIVGEGSLARGFYSLPDGTDILQAGYDKDELKKYSDESENGYYRPNITREELEALGVDKNSIAEEP